MITITNGNKELTVTRGAYDNIFRRMGYHPVETERADISPLGLEDENTYEEPETASEDENEDPEDEEEDLFEKPIGEMSFKELLEYAKANGIDIRGCNSKKEVLEAIEASEG